MPEFGPREFELKESATFLAYSGPSTDSEFFTEYFLPSGYVGIIEVKRESGCVVISDRDKSIYMPIPEEVLHVFDLKMPHLRVKSEAQVIMLIHWRGLPEEIREIVCDFIDARTK